jgi:mannitol/fructose-specific phosphotransferase system IIA component (Ntr-type)/CheY-like chemotaxis protein
MNEHDKLALVPKTPAAIGKTKPGTKRILSDMVADTLALVNKEPLRKAHPLRIVIVNDEEGPLRSFEIIIRHRFKHVTILCFGNGAEALQELMQTDPDLLITDDIMPGMGGQELCQRLFDRQITYPIILHSSWGESAEQWVREFANRGNRISFLAVPFGVEDLSKAVEAALKIPRDIAASHPVSILFSAEHIIPNLKAKERFAVIREMVAHLINIDRIRPQDEEVVMDAINKRENEMSTGWGFGFASPRGRVNCVKDIILAVGVSASGVEFNAIDNQPVNLIVMFIIPADSMSHNVKVMRFEAKFLQTFHKTHFEQFLHSKSSEEIWSLLKPVYDDALQAV